MKERNQFISCTGHRIDSTRKVLIFLNNTFFESSSSTVRILYNLLIHVEKREKKKNNFLCFKRSYPVIFHWNEEKEKRDKKIAIDDVVQLKDSSCRAGRPVSEDIAGNHQFSTPLDMLIFHLLVRIYPTEHKWKDLRGRSVSFRLECKISRHIALENCVSKVSPVELDRCKGCTRGCGDRKRDGTEE